jgi:CPA2 family monovalent cation:H+ antiporter-2
MNEEISFVSDLALILISAGIVTLIFRRIKQPLVLGYIVAGFLVGPHFQLLPTIIAEQNVTEWSEIGIIFLLFALGLEFNLKKLMNVGGSAIITAITEVLTMLCVGFFVGHLLGWTTMESIFLGGMLSMSSTTIIIKAFNDLGLRNQKFTVIVFGTLVIEDIVAILMMVMLSTVAVSRQFTGSEMAFSLLKLGFFLILCFLVGIYVLPSFFRRVRKWMNEETLLIISIGLCFGLVVLATHLGFSAALGAFIMGSILAVTIEGEHVEHLIKNIKDLFGAIFFVSVGMMVNPHVLVDYWVPVLVLTLVTIVGKSFFSSVGVLLSGQSLKTSIQSGFSLAQIGEFAFIIATLGYTLGVMREFIYPVIVTISVITTFTTPYFIRLANPFYEWLNPRLSPKFKTFLENYSSGGSSVNYESDWKKLLKYYLTHIVVYSVILIAIIGCFSHWVYPFTGEKLAGLPELWRHLIDALLTIAVMLPFLVGLITSNQSKKEIIRKLYKEESRFNRSRLTALMLFRLFLATFFIMIVLFIHFRTTSGPVILIFSSAIITFIFYTRRHFKAHWKIEDHFLSNLNQKEEHEKKKQPLRTSLNAQLSNRDIHLTAVTVSPDSPFIGKTIAALDLRRNYGVNIVKITRGRKEIYIPSGDEFIYPSDVLLAIGTDTQIASFTEMMEADTQTNDRDTERPEISIVPFVIEDDSELLGKSVANSGIRDLNGMIVEIDRGEESFVNPDKQFEFQQGDLVWIAGQKDKIQQILSRKKRIDFME